MNRGLARASAGGRLAGVDLGGTWVRVAVSGARPRAFRGPTPGPARLPALLERLWRRWRLARRDLATLGVASRGVWTRAERQALAGGLRRFAPRVVVISDVEAAYLAALGPNPGVLLLAGTGSIALGRDRRGRWSRAGGLGPLLGDDGSAFSVGRAWLRSDSVPPSRARRIATAPDAVARIAAVAPSVLRRARKGSPVARQIVREAQLALADLVQTAAQRDRQRQGIRMSWAGGLLSNQNFRAGIWRELRRRGIRVTLVPPRATATTPSAWLSSL
jgi:N-acetylglucosamine kinase-like BadF-type ATPase